MGRGGDEQLQSGRRRQASDLLFNPPVNKVVDLYKPSEEAAKKKAESIYLDIQKGEVFPFIQAVDEGKGSIRDNPLFLSIFKQLAQDAFPDFLQTAHLPKRAKGLAKEREEITEDMARSLLSDSEGVLFDSSISVSQKKEVLEGMFQIRHQDLLPRALGSRGPLGSVLRDRLAVEPADDIDEIGFRYLLASPGAEQDEEKRAIFAEIVRRQAFLLMHRAAPSRTWKRPLRYGFLSIGNKGDVMHLIDDKGYTLCSKNRDVTYQQRSTPGQWRDGKITASIRQCSACRKKGGPELQEADEERGDYQAAYFGQAAQKSVEELSKGNGVFMAAKRALLGGRAEDVAPAIRKMIAQEVGDIMARAAEDEEAGLLFSAGGHIAWADVEPGVANELSRAGYEIPQITVGHDRYLRPGQDGPEASNEQALKRSKDPLLLATSKNERATYIKALVLAALEDDQRVRFRKEAKGKEILNASLKRFLRSKKATDQR